MDSESQTFFTVMSARLPTTRVLLLMTHRPEYQHAWSSKTSYTQLRLDPLGREEADDLLAALLGEGAEPQSLKEYFLTKSEGNPFFLEDLVQALMAHGVLRRNADGGAEFKLVLTTTPLTAIQLPLTAQDVLAARAAG